MWVWVYMWGRNRKGRGKGQSSSGPGDLVEEVAIHGAEEDWRSEETQVHLWQLWHPLETGPGAEMQCLRKVAFISGERMNLINYVGVPG